MEMDRTGITFKVALIGDSYVGKDELLKTLSQSKEVVRMPFLYKTLRVQGNVVRLHIWNVSSNDRYYPLIGEMLTRGALGAVVVYDVTSRNSFERIHRIFKLFEPDTSFVLLGNKSDLCDLREVAKEEGETLAAEMGIRLIETSAKNDVNVEEAFTVLAEDMLLQQELKIFKKIVTPSDDSSDDLLSISPTAGRQLLANTTQSGPNHSLSKSALNKLLKFGVEKNYHIRVMLVGNEGVGKSTLLRRLLKLPVKINRYDSTNGIDLHINSCGFDIDTGAWCVDDTHKTGVTLMDSIWKYLGVASSNNSTSKELSEHRSFHKRVAKMLTNRRVLTDTIKNARREECIQTDSSRETGSKSNEQITTRELGTNIVKSGSHGDNHSSFSPSRPSIGRDDIDTIATQAKSLAALNEKQKGRIDFYDFAGQLVFHASHPTFLSSKAIYILAFNLNTIYSNRITSKVNDGWLILDLTSHQQLKLYRDGKVDENDGDVSRGSGSDVDSIFFWLNILYMFAATKRHIHPHVILVGTHADKLPKANRDQVADMCFREIRSLLADSPLKQVLSDKEFLIDNTKTTDPSFTQLQTEIFNLAQLQPDWGIETPARWLPLEREIQNAKNSGLKVLSLARIREVNSRLDIHIHDETELHMFLKFLNDTGDVIYINEPGLRDTVVLDPVWLIDALKALITADRFAIRSLQHADKWKRFCESGTIPKETILAIFKANTDNPALFENSEHVLKLMEKFLFIASPIDISEHLGDTEGADKKTDDVYIVPSMVQKQMNSDLNTLPEGLSSTTVYCMVAKNNFLPAAVFYKLLAKCISKWHIVEQGRQKQIFCDVCKFNLDGQRHCKLIIISVQHAIHARVFSYVDIHKPRPDLCKFVYEFLTEALRSVLKSTGFSDDFRTCIQCPRFSPNTSGGYLDTDLMDNQEFITCDVCPVSHVIQTADLLGYWTSKRSTFSDVRQMTQTDQVADDIKMGQYINDLKAGDRADEGTRDRAEETDNEQLLDVPISQGHLNHARVCNALVTVCADGLRDILQSQIPPGYHDFYGLLRARRPALINMRNLRQEQLDTLFPDPRGRYMGTLDQFDITLLYTLVRNISSVPPPVTGWGKGPMDNPRDTSLGAATERIRICRNCVSGHSMDGRLDDQSFEHYWKEICLVMDDIEKSLGAKGYQDALKKRKDQVLSPAEAQSLRSMFIAFQADVLAAVDLVLETMGNLKARVGKTCP